MRRQPSPGTRVLYRAIVRLAPRDVRDRFGGEQVHLFERIWREERPAASRVRAGLWTAAQIARALASVAALWIDRASRGGARGDLGITGRPAGWRVPVLSDLRYAVRTLARSPWFAVASVGVLTASIALVAAAFAVVDGVLFKPLPFPHASELHLVRATALATPTVEPLPVAGWDLAAWTEAVPEIAATGIRMSQPFSLDRREYGEIAIDERFFDVLGTRPMLGGFIREDFEAAFDPGGREGFWRPLVISYRVWLRHYRGDPAVVGRAVTVSTREGRAFGYRIRGVLPRDFVMPVDLGEIAPDILTPESARRMRGQFAHAYQLVARVPAGANLAAMRGRLLAATRQRALAPPSVADPEVFSHREAANWRPIFDDVQLVPLAEHLGWRSRPAFAAVFSGAAVLLILACINVAGLAAGRSLDRQREFAIKRALGASGWALSRELLAETAVLSALSTGLGLLCASPLVEWTLGLLPPSVALLKAPAIDARVILASVMGATAVVGLAVWWPAHVACRASLTGAMGRGSGFVVRPGRRSNFVLVTAQVALGFVLLCAGGLTTMSLAKAWASDAGYDRARLVSLPAFLEQEGKDDQERLLAFGDLLRRLPGVENAAASDLQMFVSRVPPWTAVMPRGWTGELPAVKSTRVDDHYFAVVGLRLVEGRWPVPGEWRNDAPIAVVSETAARQLWPGRSALGQVLTPRRADPSAPLQQWRVIAVAGDARYRALDEDPLGTIYQPGPIDRYTYGSFFVVRTSQPPERMLAPLIAAAKAGGFWVDKPSTFRDAMFGSIKHRVLPAWLFGSLGVVGLLVLGAGVLGLLAMAAARRTREMGIRLALGATSPGLVGLLVREQLRAVGAGLLCGGVISLWTVRGLASQLYGVRPYDPVVWALVAGAIVVIAVGATVVPAARAAGADPVAILRAE